MGKDWIARWHWDRIGVAILILLGVTSGLRALVSASPDDFAGQASLSGEGLAFLSGEALDAADLRLTPAEPAETELVDGEEDRDDAEPDVLVAPSTVQPEVATTGPLPRKGVLPCTCSKSTMRKLARNPYTQHQKRARTLPGSFFVKTEAELIAGARRGDMLKVTGGKGYHLANLTHSEPYLLHASKSILDEVGRRFAEAMEGTPEEGASIRVTSLTRTQRQHKRLRRRNSNAARGNSTHNYGASFDIYAIDRLNNKMTCGNPTWALQAILLDMQKSGRILIIPERGCMHITPK